MCPLPDLDAIGDLSRPTVKDLLDKYDGLFSPAPHIMSDMTASPPANVTSATVAVNTPGRDDRFELFRREYMGTWHTPACDLPKPQRGKTMQQPEPVVDALTLLDKVNKHISRSTVFYEAKRQCQVAATSVGAKKSNGDPKSATQTAHRVSEGSRWKLVSLVLTERGLGCRMSPKLPIVTEKMRVISSVKTRNIYLDYIELLYEMALDVFPEMNEVSIPGELRIARRMTKQEAQQTVQAVERQKKMTKQRNFGTW